MVAVLLSTSGTNYVHDQIYVLSEYAKQGMRIVVYGRLRSLHAFSSMGPFVAIVWASLEIMSGVILHDRNGQTRRRRYQGEFRTTDRLRNCARWLQFFKLNYKLIDASSGVRAVPTSPCGSYCDIYALFGHIDANVDWFLRHTRLLHTGPALRIRASFAQATVRALLK